MGAWDTGIFDNDHAADFSSFVEACSDIAARHDLLTATLGAFLEAEYEADALAGDYEFPSETEATLASAAYVADAKNGRHEFTDNAYAMGHDESKDLDDDDAWYHIDLGTPGPELVDQAVKVVEKVLAQMVKVQVEDEWQEPTRAVLAAFQE